MHLHAPYPAELVIDASALDTGHRGRGIGRYVAALCGELREQDPSIAPLRLTEQPGAWCVELPTRHFPRFLAARRSLARELLDAGCRVFGATEPWTLPASGELRVVPTCHDVIPLEFPGEYGGWTHAKWKAYFAWIRARRIFDNTPAIITPSEATRRGLQHYLNVDPRRVHVVAHGVDHERFSPPSNAVVDDARRRLGLGAEPFFVYVGGFDFRKNVPMIIDAFGRDGLADDALLVLAGGSDDATRDALLQRADDHGVLQRTVWCERISDDELVGLLGGALGFVYPSLSEGFGLQVLEAMATGCPVVTSDRSALAEVADDAALLVDPESADALVDAMRRLTDSDTRATLRERGIRRAAQFDWARCARQTLDVYRSVL